VADATAPPLQVLVAAGPFHPGVERTLLDAEAAARDGVRVGVFFTEAGLDVLGTPWPHRLAEAGASLSMCARSARLRKVDPVRVLADVRWSSLTAFVRDVPADASLWGLFP
jgi:predicted peroxiredoxin